MNGTYPKILGVDNRSIAQERIQSSSKLDTSLPPPSKISVVSKVCNIDREGGNWRKLGNDRLKGGVFAVAMELDPKDEGGVLEMCF